MSILPFRLYQLLSEHTDPDHALPMRELRRLLRVEYGLRCDRRAVYAALDKLRFVGCDIPAYQDGGEGYRLLSRTLEPAEVRLIADAISAFQGISAGQCEKLLDKLQQGLSRWQREQCRPLIAGPAYRSMNRETLLATEVLEEAIAHRCMIQFQYMEYGMDKRLHPRRERPYEVSPYGLCFSNGNYYLLCRYPGFAQIGHYRVDRIQSPILLEDRPSEPLPPGLDLPRYVRERVYQFSGDSIHALLHCDEDLLSDVLDRFGSGTQLWDNGDGSFEALVVSEPDSLKYWALQYVERCQIAEPAWLRREIGALLRESWCRYQDLV